MNRHIIKYYKLKSGLNVETFNFMNNDSEYFSKQVAEFIFKINTTRDENKYPTQLQVDDFKSKINKVNEFAYFKKIAKKIESKKELNTIIKTPKFMIKKEKKRSGKKEKKPTIFNTEENIDHLLIPIFKNLLNILACPSLDYRCNEIL